MVCDLQCIRLARSRRQTEEGLRFTCHRFEGIDLTVTVERIVAHAALACLWRAIIHGREEGVNRKIRRASQRVCRVGELRGYRT